jgi:hypothetical protein
VERADGGERRRSGRPAHRLLRPRIEMKKDERMACAPRTRRSVPGIIDRIVRG